MKTKLLKKVRRRFEIFHYPNGVILDKTHYNYNLYALYDNSKGSWHTTYARLVDSVNTPLDGISDYKRLSEKECIDTLKEYIISLLRHEGHKGRKDKDKIINMKPIKIWFK